MSGRSDQVRYADIPDTFRADAATLTNAELGEKYHRSEPQIVRWRRVVGVPSQVRAIPHKTFPDPGAVNWRESGTVLIEGDCVVTSDWHVPYHRFDLANRMLEVAKKRKIRQVAIVGDLFDAATLSVFDPVEASFIVREELTATVQVLQQLLRNFDRVYWSAGNHEHRLLRALKFQANLQDVGAWLVKDERLVVTGLPHMVLESGGEKFRLTHPRSYSRLATRVASELAAKYGTHVCSAHGHLFGMTMAKNGAHYAIDLGGMFDAAKIGYLNLLGDTTHPEANSGFWVIEDGAPTGYGPPSYARMVRDDQRKAEARATAAAGVA